VSFNILYRGFISCTIMPCPLSDNVVSELLPTFFLSIKFHEVAAENCFPIQPPTKSSSLLLLTGYHVQSSSYPQPFSVSSQPTKSISAQVPYANLSGYYQPGAAPPSYSTALNQPATA